MFTHPSDIPQTCNDCGLTFKTKASLKSHIYEKHKKVDIAKKCLICGKEFKNQVRFSEKR
jgi:uncharacterized CHY-type Zn-finger protein